MIVGIGTDMVEIARVKKMLEDRHAEKFIGRVLTDAERKLAEERQGRLHEFVAGRFAAKEAVVKALGCGIGRLAGFRDVEIAADSYGRPVCRIADAALKRTGLPPGARIHVSITHSQSTAAAFAVIELPDSSGAAEREG